MAGDIPVLTGAQQSELVIHTNTSTFFKDSFPYRPIQGIIELSVLSSKSLSVIYFIYRSVYMSPQSPSLSLPLLIPCLIINFFTFMTHSYFAWFPMFDFS